MMLSRAYATAEGVESHARLIEMPSASVPVSATGYRTTVPWAAIRIGTSKVFDPETNVTVHAAPTYSIDGLNNKLCVPEAFAATTVIESEINDDVPAVLCVGSLGRSTVALLKGVTCSAVKVKRSEWRRER